jgi:hypothetical protein
VAEEDAKQLQVCQRVGLLRGRVEAAAHELDEAGHEQRLALGQREAQEHEAVQLLDQHHVLQPRRTRVCVCVCAR